MTPEDIRLSLFEVSSHLGVSPSAVKKRVVNLNLPVLRGARGKLIFDARAYALLQQADELLKAGHGFDECRRQLGLEAPPVVEVLLPTPDPLPVTPTDPVKLFRAARRHATAAPVTQQATVMEAPPETVAEVAPVSPGQPEVTAEAPDAPAPGSPAPDAEQWVVADQLPILTAEPSLVADQLPIVTAEPSLVAESSLVVAQQPSVVPEAIAPAATPAPARTAPADTAPPTVTGAPASVSEGAAASGTDDFPAAWPAALQPTDTSKVRALPPPIMVKLGRSKSAPPLSPDMLARLDAALRLLDDKDRQNQMLQSKLLVAYDEMTKLSATAAAFQERSLNLAHEVQKLQGEMRLLAAPPSRKPWWKFWT